MSKEITEEKNTQAHIDKVLNNIFSDKAQRQAEVSNGKRSKPLNPIKKKLVDILSDPNLAKLSKLSMAVLDVAGKIATAKGGPLATVSALGSVVNLLRENLEIEKLPEKVIFTATHGLESRFSVLPKFLKDNNLLTLCNFENLACFKDSESRMMGRVVGDSMFALHLQGNNEGFESQVYFTGKGEEIFEKEITAVVWGILGSSGLLLNSRSYSMSFTSIRHEMTTYIGKNDPVRFADKVQYFNDKGLSYSVMLHGLPGTGKTAFLLSYAELARKKLLVIGPEVFNEINNDHILRTIKVLNPDILLMDDVDKISDDSFMYTSLLIAKKDNPLMMVAFTCNNMDNLNSAFLRPGRSGEIIEFLPPSTKEKEELLQHYMRIVSVDPEQYDLKLLINEMKSDNFTHDWVRFVGINSLLYPEQSSILQYTKDLNKKAELMSRNHL